MSTHPIRFNIVIGKGGVGKTLVSILNGMHSAAQGKKTLICELNTNESVSERLGSRPSNGQIIEVSERLWVVNIRPEEALMEYANLKLGLPSVSKLVFGNPLVNALTDFVPGMSDLLMFGKAFNHVRELDKQNRPIWDQVIIDAPATGHGLTFLKLPSVIAQAIPSGNMHDEATLMHSLLTDTSRTRIDVVTIPEPLPIRETIQLHEQLQREQGLQIGRLIINRYPARLLSDEHWHLLNKFTGSNQATLQWLKEEEGYARRMDSVLKDVTTLGLPTIRLPEVPNLGSGQIQPGDLDLMLEGYK